MASLYEQYLGNNRDYIYNTLGKSSDEAGNRGNSDQVKAMGYRDYADAAYDPILHGQGGYRPDEQSQIIGADRLDQMQLTPEQQDSAYLTQQEQQGIQGDPSSRAIDYNPTGDLNATYGEGGRARGIAGQGVDVAANYLNEARGIADPNKLEQSQDFVDRYRMSPDQVNDYATSAARDSTAVSQAAMDRAREAGTAAGMDPLGMASYLDRANRRARQDSARGASAARVQALKEQADREMNIEQNRQNAQQQSTGLRLNAAGAGYGAVGKAIDTSLASENEGDARAQQQRQFNTTTGTGIAAAQEDQRTQAARDLAANRQKTNLTNRNDVYSRQQYGDTQLAGRTAGVADTRMAQEKEARGYLTNQGNTQDTLAQQEYNRQQQGYGATSGAVQGNLGLQFQNDNKPSWWEKLLSAGTQAAGAAGSLGVKV